MHDERPDPGFSHPEIVPYLSSFKLPKNFEVFSSQEKSIQDVFAKSAMLITDYSSVAFDMAYLEKPIIYYQFDEEDFFSSHYTKGYYCYRNDGFGPVLEHEDEVVNYAEAISKNNFEYDSMYKSRALHFFPYRDGACCDRTYKAIIELDKGKDLNGEYAKILQKYAERASLSCEWDFANMYWEELVNNSSDVEESNFLKLKYAESLREKGALLNSYKSIKEIDSSFVLGGLCEYLLNREFSLHAYMALDYDLAVDTWEGVFKTSSHHISILDKLNYMECLAESNRTEKLVSFYDELDSKELCIHEKAKADALVCLAENDIYQGIEIIEFALAESITFVKARQLKLDLLLARFFNEVGLLKLSYYQMDSYVLKYNSDRAWRIYIAKLQAGSQQWEKVVVQLIGAYPEGIRAMPVEHSVLYLQGLQKVDIKKAEKEASKLLGKNILSSVLIDEIARIYQQQNKLDLAKDIWCKALTRHRVAAYKLAKILRSEGKVEEALALINNERASLPITIDEWLLKGELAQLSNDMKLANYCWHAVLKFYSSDAPAWVWDRYQSSQIVCLLEKYAA